MSFRVRWSLAGLWCQSFLDSFLSFPSQWKRNGETTFDAHPNGFTSLYPSSFATKVTEWDSVETAAVSDAFFMSVTQRWFGCCMSSSCLSPSSFFTFHLLVPWVASAAQMLFLMFLSFLSETHEGSGRGTFFASIFKRNDDSWCITNQMTPKPSLPWFFFIPLFLFLTPGLVSRLPLSSVIFCRRRRKRSSLEFTFPSLILPWL